MPPLIWTPYNQAMTGAGLRLGRYDFMPWRDNLQRGLRNEDADIDEDVNAVSREHVRISPAQAGLLIEDCGSSLGTYVNGEKLTAPKMVVWDDLAATTVYLGAPCFCLRFIALDTYVEVTGTGKELSPLPLSGDTRIWLIVVGRYKRKCQALVKLIHPPESVESGEQAQELADMTMSPEQFYAKKAQGQPSAVAGEIEMIMSDTPSNVS